MRAAAASLLALSLSLASALQSGVYQPEEPSQHTLGLSNDALEHITALADTILSTHPVQDSLLLNAPDSPVTCLECRTILFSLKSALAISPSTASRLAASLCARYGKQDPDVCAGVIDLFAPALEEILPAVDPWGYSGHLACATVIKACEYPEAQGRIELAFPPELPRDKEPDDDDDDDEEPLTVVHISDWHFDPLYLTGSEVRCTKPLCCRGYNDSTHPEDVSEPAPSWGAYACDAPLKLGENMLRSVKGTLGKSPDWVIFTGDIPAHDVWATSEESTLEATNTTYSLFRSHLGAPVFPTVGNHETSPTDLFQPSEIANPPYNQWLFDSLSTSWAGWLDEETAEYARTHQGSYVAYPRKGLKLISLNTNDCYVQNFYLFANTSLLDPNSQLAWLAQELDASERAGERVWLISHVPAGSPDCFRHWSEAHNRIVQRYWRTISGVFSGHTHRDEFKLFYSNDSLRVPSTAIAINYLGPSLTPYTSINPGWRAYTVHPRTFEILDSHTYIADLSLAPSWDISGSEPTWELEYSAREYLSSDVWPEHAPLNATFWAHVAEAMEADVGLFEFYNLFRFKSGPGGRRPCDAECRKKVVANARAGNSVWAEEVVVRRDERGVERERDMCGVLGVLGGHAH